MTWFAAEELCEQNGGTLAVPDSAAENDFILTVRPSIAEMWIGINDLTTEAGTSGDLFQEVTGELVSVNGFRAGEPSGTNDAEDCAHYGFNESGWNDFDCNSVADIANFVCEFEPRATFSADFFQGVENTSAQCDAWNDFRAGLVGNFTKVTLRSSLDPVGVSCTGPEANTLCAALHNETSVNLSCDGRQWNVGIGCTNGGLNGTPMELSADGTDCSCSAGPTVRPCINNSNFGDVGTGQTCGAPTQTIEVVCE